MNYSKDQISDMLDSLRPQKSDESLSAASIINSSLHMCLEVPWEDNGLVCEDTCN